MTILNISDRIAPAEFLQARSWIKDNEKFIGRSLNLNSKQLKAYAVAATWLRKNGWEIGFQWSWGVEDVSEVVDRECAGLELSEVDFKQVLKGLQATQGQINGHQYDWKFKTHSMWGY